LFSLSSLTLDGGSGGNSFTVASTPTVYGGVFTLNTGDGSNSILIQSTSVPLVVNGQNGNNTLTGPNTSATWSITGADAGTISGGISFSNVENLVGGSGDDTFTFDEGGSVSGTITGGGGSTTLDYSALTEDVTVDLGAGTASFTGGVSNITGVLGGAGNNTLTGGSATTFLVGGPGANTLTAGSGRTLLIAGSGAATLNGGGDDDILIAGTTSFDNNVAALNAIMAEWGRTDLGTADDPSGFQARINDLLGPDAGGTAGGLNGTFYLNSSTVSSNGAVNTLNGIAGSDWFFASATDQVNNPGTGPVYPL
jgi:hypothetical protein